MGLIHNYLSPETIKWATYGALAVIVGVAGWRYMKAPGWGVRAVWLAVGAAAVFEFFRRIGSQREIDKHCLPPEER
jgi:hypothetical protein